MNSLVIKINTQCILYCIAFVFVIEPKLFTQYTPTVLLYAAGNLVLFVLYISKYINCINKIPKIAFLWIIFRVYILFMTLASFRFDSIDNWGYLSLQVMIMILMFEHAKNNKQFKLLFASACFVLSVYLLINAITLLTFSRGIITDTNRFASGDNDVYFLGIKVNYTAYVLPAICSAVLYYYLSKNVFPIFVVITLSVFNIFYANISTGIICVVIFILLFVLRKTIKLKVNLKLLLIIALVINFFVINFNIQEYFENFIVNYLHKKPDLTGRTLIWENAKVVLKHEGFVRLFFGNGLINDGSFVLMDGIYWPPHNQWISLLYDTGILGTGFFVFFLSNFDRVKTNSNMRFYTLSLCAAVLVGTVTMQYFNMAAIYFIFIALYYIGEIEDHSIAGEQITTK